MASINDEAMLYKLYLSFIPGAGPTKIKVLRYIFGSEKNIYGLSDTDIDSISFLGAEAKRFLKSRESKKIVADSLNIIRKKNIKMITPENAEYPELLSKIPNPPETIFQIGEAVKDHIGIGVVGSRKATEYGGKVAYTIAYEAAGHGISVISGFAVGIDFFAHKGCIDGGGRTVAVLANSIDEPYPRENRKIIKELLEKGGTILSETPPLKKIHPSEFIMRNRIISGISVALIVAEAGAKSGTLYTVDHALEQGKDIFAVPGSIFSRYSEGSNKLLKQGAAVYTCFDDICEIIEKHTGKSYRILSSCQSIQSDRFSPSKETDGIHRTNTYIGLDTDERKIIDVLRTGGRTVDEICEIIGQTAQFVCNILVLMEIKGYVMQPNMGYYEISEELFFKKT